MRVLPTAAIHINLRADRRDPIVTPRACASNHLPRALAATEPPEGSPFRDYLLVVSKCRPQLTVLGIASRTYGLAASVLPRIACASVAFVSASSAVSVAPHGPPRLRQRDVPVQGDGAPTSSRKSLIA